MLCPTCFGRRLVVIASQVVPCPECAGHGEVHCCEGLQEQPLQEQPTEEVPEEKEDAAE
jgi:hypothetical protein